ncbi:hypothetical protein L1987_13440 [Smallanthus sonchifolius]|uniref:Uncharacterized protein n=1 Tax=Smallanthus sonchifolius TaxID=185202 RepID=A0ACB9JGZ3_9ASTR|nr:hypothetical protein L1987_13440 [Smallanthus sonchifolius]
MVCRDCIFTDLFNQWHSCYSIRSYWFPWALLGATAWIQPVYVAGVASAVVAALKDDGSSMGKLYELVGPDIYTILQLELDVCNYKTTLDKMFDESGRKALVPEFAKIIQQGYAHLPGGTCMSAMGCHITYEQAVA